MKKFLFTYLILIIPLISILNAQSRTGEIKKLIGGNGEVYMSPVWSPNGKMVAFTSANYNGIRTINLENNNVKQITDEAAAGFIIKWSRNSENILSRVARFEGMKRYNAIKIFNVKTGETNQLSDYRTMMPGIPDWANGDEEVFIYNRDKLEKFSTGLTKTNIKASDKIVYKRNNKIAVGNLSTESFNIYEPVKDGEVLNLTVSPDGSRVAFEIIGGNMYSMNADGTSLVDLGIGYRPAWSPDSEYIVYMITEDDGHQITSSDLYSIKYDGSEKINLTNTTDKSEMNPSWSPDGRFIAFDVLEEGAIYIIGIDKIK
jgi:Tol biopolymer transport system component